MKAHELISLLQSLPAYADVLIDITDGEETEFKSFTVESGDDYPEKQVALIRLVPAS